MSEKLIKAIDEMKGFPDVTLGSIVDRIGDDALLIISLIAILPFMQPIPIPGLSTILGLVVMFQGVGLMVIEKPILTQRMKDAKISNERMMMIYRAAVKFDKFTSKMSVFKHPIVKTRPVRMVSGFTIMLTAAFLSLPLPIPFSNFIPALCIFFICTGLLEEDLILVLFGHGIAFTLAWMGSVSFHLIQEKFGLWI